jgi:transcriptional regulator with XRE-family HTH domain
MLYNIDITSDMEVITLRTWLKDIRVKKELTQQEVANAANVDVTMICKIELGERRPSVEVAKKIASVLEFPWTRFYEDEDDLT